ncbi:MAG: M48 family metallopeptidase [Betaproteobacteria bacterium]|nr:MAG: M48 family metallopeptidase [Betaproteobacteria bacterium]
MAASRFCAARRCISAFLTAALALSPIAGAQQNLPDLGDPSQASLSAPQERKLGESIIRQVRLSGGYMNDPEVNGYLNELGNRLVTAIPGSPFDFEFFAFPDNNINAFALPGGYVGVSTGLILLTQTESELASVLAHEISHVTQHHHARSIANQRDAMLASIAALAAAILAARSNSSSSGQATQAAIASAQGLAIQMQINFTRQNEQEADRIGFQRLEASGFDVSAMAALFQRLQRALIWFEGNSPSYFHDHPEVYERIADAQARAYTKPFRQVPDSLDFHMVRALVRSYQGTPKEAIAFFEDAIAEKKYNNATAARYGLVASLLRAEDFKRALTELAVLEKSAPPHPMIEGMAGQVLMQSGQLTTAINRYQAALARYPAKMQLVYDYPEALLKNKQPAKAAAFVSEQLQRYASDGPLHLLAARSYAALGKQLLAHQHQGEYYAWQGNLPAAVTQFELAVKAADADFYQASVAESRLREVRQELSDQKKRASEARG